MATEIEVFLYEKKNCSTTKEKMNPSVVLLLSMMVISIAGMPQNINVENREAVLEKRGAYYTMWKCMTTNDGFLGMDCVAKWNECEKGHDDTFQGYRCMWTCMIKPAGGFFGKEQCGAKWTVCEQRCDKEINAEPL